MDITNLSLEGSFCYCLIDNVLQCYGYPIVDPNNPIFVMVVSNNN